LLYKTFPCYDRKYAVFYFIPVSCGLVFTEEFKSG